jgi:hypothetical protein
MCYFVITRSRDLEVAGPSREQVVDDFDLRDRLARAMAEGSTFMRERSPATFDINGNYSAIGSCYQPRLLQSGRSPQGGLIAYYVTHLYPP